MLVIYFGVFAFCMNMPFFQHDIIVFYKKNQMFLYSALLQ